MLTFWNWRRGPNPLATQGSSALAASLGPELVPIELYTLEARIVGWIAPNGLRVTDVLNSRPEIRLWRPSPGPLDEKSMPPPITDGESGENGEWHSLRSEHIVLAMPPEWRASRQLRLHRRLDRAAVIAGPFAVTGNIHMTPGVPIGPALLQTQDFLPLTDAHILHNAEPHFEHVVSVVIVNGRHVAEIMPLVALA